MHDPKKGKPPTPDQFNPYNEKVYAKQNVPLTFLKSVFCKEKNK